MNKNNWEINRTMDYACWTAQFNTTKMLDRMEQWKYFRGILLAAEENQITRVLETEKRRGDSRKYYYSRAKHQKSYIEFADRLFENEEASPDLLFHQAINSPLNPRTQTKLCYYNHLGEVEEDYCDIFSLATKLMPGVYDWFEDFVTAVNIDYLSCLEWDHQDELKAENKEIPDTEFVENDKQYRAFSLSISLHTNIWFPWVRSPHEWGLIDGESAIIKEGEWQDNRELANRHTPRLNKFIQQVKQLSLEMGGTWEIDLIDTKLYHLQEKAKFDGNGVILDF